MKKIILIIIGILILSGFTTSDLTINAQNKTRLNQEENNEYIETIDDLSTRIYLNMLKPNQNNNLQDFNNILTNNQKYDYPLGSTIWQYTISGGSDNSPKAIISIPDINLSSSIIS